MDEKNSKRIAIFEYDWSMFELVKDMVIKLAEAGYSVDVFYKDSDVRFDFADTSTFESYENIRYFNFTTRTTMREFLVIRGERLLNRLAMHLRWQRMDKPENIIDRRILSESREIINKAVYDCFIGVEKKGLIWAGLMSELYNCPLIYYSLELYIEDHPLIHRFYHLRDAEKKYHRISKATIIQDRPRADALLKSNGVKDTNIIYLPVSVRGKSVQRRSEFLYNRLNIDTTKRILLYFGAIFPTRFLTQIVDVARELDEDWVMVLHGPGPKRYIHYLQSVADTTKVVFSPNLVEEKDIRNLISSADIGLALYDAANANDRLVAFSSAKIAYYLQCGLPIIAFTTESSGELMNSYKCGELINAVHEIPKAARKILLDYDSYKHEAYLAYERFYNFDHNSAAFITQLGRIIAEGANSRGSPEQFGVTSHPG